MGIFPEPDQDKTDEQKKKYAPTDQPDYDSSTVNRRYTNLSQLITHIEGYSWVVAFYHQILGEDDQPKPPSTDTDPTLQQYYKIHDFEIRVSDPLRYQKVKDFDQDQLSGTGSIYPGTIHPQVGDAFIADIGDGRSGIFVIDNVEPRSIMMERAFEIDYHLQASVSDKRLEDLESKVQKHLYFRKDFLSYGANPLLEKEQTIQHQRLSSLYEELVDFYAKDFIDPQTRFLLIPDQGYRSFDFFLANFIQKTIELSQRQFYRDANWPDIYQIRDLRAYTIFDLLLEPDPRVELITTDHLDKKMKLTSIGSFRGSPFLAGIYFSMLNYIVDADNSSRKAHRTLVASEKKQDYHDFKIESIDDGADRKMLYPVTIDDYYIFSSAFYSQDRTKMSLIEYMTTLMLSNENFPTDLLIECCQDSYHWSNVERFYYTPILLRLIDFKRTRSSSYG